MSQLNINMTPQFEKDIRAYMKLKSIKYKSQALRAAVADCLKAPQKQPATDFRSWLGAANKGKQSPNPRFKTHAQLWEKS